MKNYAQTPFKSDSQHGKQHFEFCGFVLFGVCTFSANPWPLTTTASHLSLLQNRALTIFPNCTFWLWQLSPMEIFLWISKPSEMDVEPYHNRMGLDGWVSLDTGIVDNEHHRVLLAKEKRLSITGNISLQDTKVHIFGGGCAASKKMTSRATAYRGWTHETHFLFQPITSFYQQSHCLQPPPTEWDQQGQLGTHRLSLLNSVKLVNIILAQVHFGHPQHQQDQGSRVKDQRSMFQCQENLCTGCFF